MAYSTENARPRDDDAGRGFLDRVSLPGTSPASGAARHEIMAEPPGTRSWAQRGVLTKNPGRGGDLTVQRPVGPPPVEHRVGHARRMAPFAGRRDPGPDAPRADRRAN